MKLRSHIDFPGFVFQKYNSRKELMACATVSALFTLDDDDVLSPAEPQRDIALSDEYADPAGHLLRPSDFVPYRPATDVTALANAYAPGGSLQDSWTVGISVGDASYDLRVHGPRHWFYDRWGGWKLSDAKPVSEVALEYAHASGGALKLPDDHPDIGDVDIWNPNGPGVVTRDTPRKIVVPAAQIESTDTPITDPYEPYQPQGFAPIAPVWRFREQFAGTYDKTWLETQHPFLPPDFDPHFYNVAHPKLQFEPFLNGDEVIKVHNMFVGRPELRFALPSLAFGAVATHDSGVTMKSPMPLDGVHLELLGRVPKVRLTWRTSFPWRDGVKIIDVGPLAFGAMPQRQDTVIA